MSGCAFGLTGRIGEAGFQATTLEGHLALFTHPEFHAVAGLPKGLDAVEATARQAAEYARSVGLVGFVVNPGTHQRFLASDAVGQLGMPLLPPKPPSVPDLRERRDPALASAVRAAAEDTAVEAAWLAEGPAVVTRPHPVPAFEAGLMARDVRVASYAAAPDWPPLFAREASAHARVRFSALSRPLPSALAQDLARAAGHHRLAELWAFEATIEEEPPVLAFALAPFPNERFAADFDLLHARHALGADSPLLDAETLREALPRMGLRLR